MVRLHPLGFRQRRFPVRISKRRVTALLIIVVALLASPSWFEWRERTRASESHRYLACIRAAQEKYWDAHQHYSKDVHDLDMVRPEPTFFAVGELKPGCTGSMADSWSLTLTRFGNVFPFGKYTVTFNQNGFDPIHSTIEGAFVNVSEVDATPAELAIR